MGSPFPKVLMVFFLFNFWNTYPIDYRPQHAPAVGLVVIFGHNIDLNVDISQWKNSEWFRNSQPRLVERRLERRLRLFRRSCCPTELLHRANEQGGLFSVSPNNLLLELGWGSMSRGKYVGELV